MPPDGKLSFTRWLYFTTSGPSRVQLKGCPSLQGIFLALSRPKRAPHRAAGRPVTMLISTRNAAPPATGSRPSVRKMVMQGGHTEQPPAARQPEIAYLQNQRHRTSRWSGSYRTGPKQVLRG